MGTAFCNDHWVLPNWPRKYAFLNPKWTFLGKCKKKQFHNCFFLLGRVEHFEFLRSLSVSLSLSPSPCLPVSPFFPPLFLLHSQANLQATMCSTRNTFNTKLRSAGFLFTDPSPDHFFFTVDIRGNDMHCNHSKILDRLVSTRCFSPVWSQPWLRVHILRPSGPDFMNCLCWCFMQFSCHPSLHWTRKLEKRASEETIFGLFILELSWSRNSDLDVGQTRAHLSNVLARKKKNITISCQMTFCHLDKYFIPSREALTPKSKSGIIVKPLGAGHPKKHKGQMRNTTGGRSLWNSPLRFPKLMQPCTFSSLFGTTVCYCGQWATTAPQSTSYALLTRRYVDSATITRSSVHRHHLYELMQPSAGFSASDHQIALMISNHDRPA